MFVPLFKVNFSLGAVETGGGGGHTWASFIAVSIFSEEMQSERLVYRRESICAQTVLLKVSYRQTIQYIVKHD